MTFGPTLPTNLELLLQSNALERMVRETLLSNGSYQLDAKPRLHAAGMGRTMSFDKLGHLSVDGRPAAVLGAVPRGSYSAMQFTASPSPYANALDVSAPEIYQQTAGNAWTDKLTRLATWCGRTKGRIARMRAFAAAGGKTVIRRAQTTSDAILLVDSLAGFRTVFSNGQMVAVSGSTPLAITIVAATTFSANVTGTTPLDADYPDGPGLLTLSGVLSANVAANSYCYVTSAAPYIVYGGGVASTEALLTTSIPVLADVLKMRSKLRDDGVLPHSSSGTYHMHVDPWFFYHVTQDTAFRQAFQAQGLSPIFSGNAVWSPAYGITIIENNDAPAIGKGSSARIGSTGYVESGGATGGTGTSLTLLDSGLPVQNSSGVAIRRAIMTGDDVMDDVYVDEMQYVRNAGSLIHQYGDSVASYNVGGMFFVAADIDRWRFMIRPPLDERGLQWTISVSSTFDLVLPIDVVSEANTADLRPLKRSIVLEHGAPAGALAAIAVT